MAKHITGQSCPLSFKGSPYWMAPEVIKNANGCNLAVDIWSLGCTVLEMATSKPPWNQYEGIAAMFKIGNSKDLPLIPDHLSDEGKDFVRQCLQREPSSRPTAAELLQHPFVRNAAPLEKSALGFDPLEQPIAVSSGLKSKGTGHARNLSSFDVEGLTIHQLWGSKFAVMASDIHMGNVSCPVSPTGSPLLNSRSPQHVSGRMTPSPISSPKTTSGSSTPLTGGNGTVPFNQPKQMPYFHEGFACMPRSAGDLYASRSTYHEARLDFLQGMQQGSPVYREQSSEIDILSPQFGRRANVDIQESYNRQPMLADRVPHQILRDPVKLKPSLDLRSASTILGRTNDT